MSLFETKPAWLHEQKPVATMPSIPYAIPVSSPSAGLFSLFRRCALAVVMMAFAVGAGSVLSQYLPKPNVKANAETAEISPQATPVVVAPQLPEAKTPPVPVLPVVVPVAPVVAPQPTVAIPTPQPKPKAVVVEEPAPKAKPFFADKKTASEAAKREGKRVLYWINGAEEIPESETLIKSLGDYVVHCRIDADGTDYDSVGPRLAWTGEDGKQWFTRASKINSGTTNNIRSKMGLPTITADGREVKFPQVVPPQDSRFRNFADRPGDGNCLWVATDTLLKTHGYNVSLSKNRWGGSNIPWAVAELKKRDVRIAYKDHFRGKDKAFLQAACDDGLGCVVTVMLPQGGHAIDLVGIQGDKVAIIDNNDPQLKTRITPIASFEQIWDGGAIAILPKDYNGALTHYVRQCSPGGSCPVPSARQGGRQLDADAPESPLDTGAFGAPIIKNAKAVEDAARQFFRDAGFTESEIEQRIRNK